MYGDFQVLWCKVLPPPLGPPRNLFLKYLPLPNVCPGSRYKEPPCLFQCDHENWYYYSGHFLTFCDSNMTWQYILAWGCLCPSCVCHFFTDRHYICNWHYVCNWHYLCTCCNWYIICNWYASVIDNYICNWDMMLSNCDDEKYVIMENVITEKTITISLTPLIVTSLRASVV